MDLHEDVFQIIREIARDRSQSMGKVISDLARRGLAAAGQNEPTATRNGVPLLPKRTGPRQTVTPETIQHLIDTSV